MSVVQHNHHNLAIGHKSDEANELNKRIILSFIVSSLPFVALLAAEKIQIVSASERRIGTPPNITESIGEIGPFHLKLYWQQGYYWQEETIERKWCVEPSYPGKGPICADDVQCTPGVDMFIMTCNSTRKEQQWVRIGKTFRPAFGSNGQASKRDQCWTREDKINIRLRKCVANDPTQQWEGFSNDGKPFSISHFEAYDKVVSQMHHPKAREFIWLVRYKQAAAGPTHYWNTWH